MRHQHARSLMAMSRRDTDDLYASMRDAYQHLRPARDASTESAKTNQAIALFETAAGAGAVAFLAGRLGTANIPETPIPLGLAAGAVGHLATLFDLVPKKFEKHVHHTSNGCVAGYTALWASAQGLKMREAAGHAGARIEIGASLPTPTPSLSRAPAAMPAAPTPPIPDIPRPLTEAELTLRAQQRARK